MLSAASRKRRVIPVGGVTTGNKVDTQLGTGNAPFRSVPFRSWDGVARGHSRSHSWLDTPSSRADHVLSRGRILGTGGVRARLTHLPPT
jgi:hypothetical protein